MGFSLMPLVHHTMELSQSNDPSNPASTVIHLDTMLSELYGKNIRQGNTFNVKAVQCSLVPKDDGYDTGMATTVRFSYAPTTKHSRKAWNHAFTQWASQKKLAGRLGRNLNNDDFETTYSTSYLSYVRTSTLRQGGLSDSDSDKVAIYGNSSELTDVMTLEDLYESIVPVPSPSKYSWNNIPIKQMKYTSHFPEERRFATSAILSADVSEAGEFPSVYLGGANSASNIIHLPEVANVMCGHLEIDAWVIADDTLTQDEDPATLLISIWVDSWKPLAYPRSKPSPRRTPKKGKAGRKNSGRQSRKRGRRQ